MDKAEVVLEIGTKVTGCWGAMIPWSYGEIIAIEDDEAEIKWEDDSPVDKDLGNTYILLKDIELEKHTAIGISVRHE